MKETDYSKKIKSNEKETERRKWNAIQNWKKERKLCYWVEMKWHETKKIERKEIKRRTKTKLKSKSMKQNLICIRLAMCDHAALLVSISLSVGH